MTEAWKAIAGWPSYEISDIGRVRRVRSRDRAASPGVGDVLKPFARRDGYLTVNLTRKSASGEHEQKRFDVHRLVADAFLGPIPPRVQVNHKDLDKHNPRLANLELVTQSENLRHAYLHGRMPHLRRSGSDNSQSRLTNSDVICIRWRAAFGEQQKTIRADFGLSHPGMSHIVRGKNWTHLRGLLTANAIETIEVIQNG